MACAVNLSMGVTRAKNNKKNTVLKKITAFIYNLDKKISSLSLPHEQNKKATFWHLLLTLNTAQQSRCKYCSQPRNKIIDVSIKNAYNINRNKAVALKLND
tara:strand:- start:213 stop:515 length:303 start_codon:yes stop_codon:yes gene_type:complete